MATLTYNPKDMEDDVSTKAQPRPISLAYTTLCENIEHCYKVFGILEERLEPILGPDFPCQSKEEALTTERSSLASSMCEQCNKLSRLIDKVKSLEKRIEI